MTSDKFYGQLYRHFPFEPLALDADKKHLADHELWLSIEPHTLHADADLFFKKILKRAPGFHDLQIFPRLKTGVFTSRFPIISDMRMLIQFLTIKNMRVEIGANKEYFSSRSLYAAVIRLNKEAYNYSPSQLEKMLLIPAPSMVLCDDEKQEMRFYYFLNYADENEFVDNPVDMVQLALNNHLFLKVQCGAGSSIPLPGSLCSLSEDTGQNKQCIWSVSFLGGTYSAGALITELNKCASSCPELQFFPGSKKIDKRITKISSNRSTSDVIRAYKALEDNYRPSAYICSLFLFYSLLAALYAAGLRNKSELTAMLNHWQVEIPSILLSDSRKLSLSYGELASYFWEIAGRFAFIEADSCLPSSTFHQHPASSYRPEFPRETSADLALEATTIRHAKDDVARLKEYTLQVCSDSEIDPMDHLTLVRAYARSLSISFDTQYLQQQILQSVRQIHGTSEGIGTERPIDFSPVPWLWDKILIQKTANLLVAHPKCGKTSLIISFISALLDGDDSFLGFHIYRSIRPAVLIVGTDQPESDWGRMLSAANLLTDSNHLRPGLVDLYTATNPLHLDTQGIQRIVSYAKEHPGLIIFLDSLAACTLPLGIDENSSQAVIPVMKLINEVSVFESTIIIVHHSSKSSFSQSASSASRGSSAIPAAMSQIISLERFCPEDAKPETGDNRLVLKTQGRAGSPIKQIIQRTDKGWINLGCGDRMALIQKQNQVIEDLTDRQKAVYLLLEERWNDGEKPTTTDDVKQSLPDYFKGIDHERSIRSVFEQLLRRKLVKSLANTKPTQWYPETLLGTDD